MDIGKLNRYIRIEAKSVDNDADYGGQTVTWTLYKYAWADVKDITTRQQESTNSDLRLLKRPCKVMMRYDDTITSDMRIVLIDRDNRILNIVTKPAEIGNKDGIEFQAEEYSV